MIKRSILYLLIFIMLFSLVSCDKTKDNDNYNVVDIDDILLNKEPFTIIMCQDYSVQDINAEGYIEELEINLYEKGFNINLDIVPWSKYGAEYEQYVTERIESGENIAFISSSFSKSEKLSLINDNKIMEISEQFKKYAPGFYERTFCTEISEKTTMCNNTIYQKDEKDKAKIYGVPIGTMQSFNYSALLVKKDIAQNYGKDINTFKDYENLLRYIKENNEEYIPGLFPLKVTTIMALTGAYNFFDFFANINGYSDASGIIGELGSSDFYYYKNMDIKSVKEPEEINVVPVIQIPGFKDYILKLCTLRDEGLIDFWTNYNRDDIIYEKYASIVVNPFIYMRPEFNFYPEVFINAKDYYMYLFNKEEMIFSTGKLVEPYNTVLYISGNSKSIGEILYFIEWLYKDQENYNLLMYGKKDDDYTIRDNRLGFTEKNGRAFWGENQFSIFKNYELDSMRSYHPVNWDKILEQISNVPDNRLISVNEYIKENSGITDDDIKRIKEEELAGIYEDPFDTKSIAFTNDIEDENDTYDMEIIIKDYIEDILNIEEIKDIEKKYSQYINELFKYLK